MTQTIPINKNDLVAIARKQSAIETQQEILDALQDALSIWVAKKYGIDLVGDNWVLDLDRGVLEQDAGV